MSKSTQEKELERIILQFFKENPIKFEPIAKKIGLNITSKSEGRIPVKFMFPLIQQIAKYGFSIGKYEFWTIENETEIKKLYAINMNDFIKTEDLKFVIIESLEDVFKLMNK